MTILSTCYLWCLITSGQTEYRLRINCLMDRHQYIEMSKLEGRDIPKMICEERK